MLRRRHYQFVVDLRDQALVARHANQKVHPVRLTPCHQHLTGKAEIAAQQNAHPWPVLAELRDNARDSRLPAEPSMFDRNLAASRCRPHEDVERQIAVAVVIAVEEAAFLMPVQRVVRRIEVENDLLRSPPMCLQNRSTNNVSIIAASWLTCDNASVPPGSAPAGSVSICPPPVRRSRACSTASPPAPPTPDRAAAGRGH